MHWIYPALAIACLLCGIVRGQTAPIAIVERALPLTHTHTPIGVQELANAVRAITGVKQASPAVDAKSLVVRGTASQIAVAEWLFRALDQPAGYSGAAKAEIAISNTANELSRVFYIVNANSPRSLQEIVNSIRSVGEIQRIMVCNQPKALAVRGTAAHIALAEWVIQALNKPVGGGPFATQSMTLSSPEYRLPDGSVSMAKVFYPSFVSSPQQLQEGVNMLRTITEIQRAVARSEINAVVVRGTNEEVALAEWLLNALKTAPIAEAPTVPMPPRFGTFVTRIFYLRNISSPKGLQDVVNTLRSKTGLMRLSTYNAAGAIALRGTLDQATQAERLIREMDQAPAQQ